MRDKIIYDISVLLGKESAEYPGDPPFSREVISDLGRNSEYELSLLTMSAHAGTHIDAPSHFVKGGKSIAQYSACDFVLPAIALNIHDSEVIRPSEINSEEIGEGDAVLFKTRNSMSGLVVGGGFSERYVYLSHEAADLLVAKKVAMVGIDYLSVDRFGDDLLTAHKKLLGAGILILENINLAEVPPGRYTLVCPPLKIRAEAAPVRAILIKQQAQDNV